MRSRYLDSFHYPLGGLAADIPGCGGQAGLLATALRSPGDTLVLRKMPSVHKPEVYLPDSPKSLEHHISAAESQLHATTGGPLLPLGSDPERYPEVESVELHPEVLENHPVMQLHQERFWCRPPDYSLISVAIQGDSITLLLDQSLTLEPSLGVLFDSAGTFRITPSNGAIRLMSSKNPSELAGRVDGAFYWREPQHFEGCFSYAGHSSKHRSHRPSHVDASKDEVETDHHMFYECDTLEPCIGEGGDPVRELICSVIPSLLMSAHFR